MGDTYEKVAAGFSMTRPTPVAQLAREAALSRSAFFERFSRAMGVAPMARYAREHMESAGKSRVNSMAQL
jgi:transcriptional regulator GlxA family with amidase domain